ncbi:unnamed protein product, partial [Musa acuminata var. zebrina]
ARQDIIYIIHTEERNTSSRDPPRGVQPRDDIQTRHATLPRKSVAAYTRQKEDERKKKSLLLLFAAAVDFLLTGSGGWARRGEAYRTALDVAARCGGGERGRHRVGGPPVGPEPLGEHVAALPPRRDVQAACSQRPPRRVRHRPYHLPDRFLPCHRRPRQARHHALVRLRRPRHLELRREIQIHDVPPALAVPVPRRRHHVDVLVIPRRQPPGGVPPRLADPGIVPRGPQPRHHRSPEGCGAAARPQPGDTLRRLGDVSRQPSAKRVLLGRRAHQLPKSLRSGTIPVLGDIEVLEVLVMVGFPATSVVGSGGGGAIAAPGLEEGMNEAREAGGGPVVAAAAGVARDAPCVIAAEARPRLVIELYADTLRPDADRHLPVKISPPASTSLSFTGKCSGRKRLQV